MSLLGRIGSGMKTAGRLLPVLAAGFIAQNSYSQMFVPLPGVGIGRGHDRINMGVYVGPDGPQTTLSGNGGYIMFPPTGNGSSQQQNQQQGYQSNGAVSFIKPTAEYSSTFIDLNGKPLVSGYLPRSRAITFKLILDGVRKDTPVFFELVGEKNRVEYKDKVNLTKGDVTFVTCRPYGLFPELADVIWTVDGYPFKARHKVKITEE